MDIKNKLNSWAKEYEGSPNFLKKLKESDVDKLYDYLQRKK